MANGRPIAALILVKKSEASSHPLHATAVPDLQLLLGPLEATVFLVVGGGLEVDVNVVDGLGSRRGD